MKVYQIQKRTISEPPNNWMNFTQHNDLQSAMHKARDWITRMKSSTLVRFKDCESDIRVVELENDEIQNYHYFISSN